MHSFKVRSGGSVRRSVAMGVVAAVIASVGQIVPAPRAEAADWVEVASTTEVYEFTRSYQRYNPFTDETTTLHDCRWLHYEVIDVDALGLERDAVWNSTLRWVGGSFDLAYSNQGAAPFWLSQIHGFSRFLNPLSQDDPLTWSPAATVFGPGRYGVIAQFGQRAEHTEANCGGDHIGSVVSGTVMVRSELFDKPPEADFVPTTIDPSRRQVRFTNLSADPSGGTLTYLWNFGDGATSMEESPTHLFPFVPNSFEVTLEVRSSTGYSATITRTVRFDVSLTARFSYEASEANPLEIKFTNLSTHPQGLPMTYRWTFREGATSTQEHPTHTFPAPGTYFVTLRADDGLDRSHQVTSVVEVTSTGLVVNSTGDGAAVDVAERGCDTGETVGDEPECTLRAAIEAANARGGGKITFAIPGAGLPAIVPAEPLPTLTSPTEVDGTTQPGGFVELRGGGAVAVGIQAAGGGSRVTGMVFDRFENVGLAVVSGSDYVVEGNRFGTAGEGLVVGAFALNAPGARIVDNTFERCLTCVQASDSAGVVIERNRVGIAPDGQATGIALTGVSVRGGPATVSGNVVRSSDVGVVVAGAQAGGSRVTGNRFGVDLQGAGFNNAGTGIRIDGTPDVTVADNVVTSRGVAGILVSGSLQSTQSGSVWTMRNPDDELVPGPVIGGRTVITGNTVGVLGNGTTASANVAAVGIFTWAGASGVRIEGNTVANQTEDAIKFIGGSDHIAKDNVVREVPDGIALQGTTGAKVEGNQVEAANVGVRLSAFAEGNRVADNRIRAGLAGVYAGLFGAETTTIEGNEILAAEVGIENESAATTITGNRLGISSTGTITGNGTGILSSRRDVAITDNVVVGSTENGIRIGPGGTANLRGNAVYGSGEQSIVTATGPAAPRITAALRTSHTGTDRTVLLVGGLPADEAGRVEVFSNDGCGDAEARHVLRVNVNKRPGRDFAIVPVLGQGDRDSFTVTYTSPSSGTSALSNCEARDTYPDADGDGSPDPIEDLVGTASDPARAALITDTGDVLLLTTAAGTLAAAAVADDPDPGGHPGGFTLPHGVVDFEVRGLERGATTTVQVLVVDGDPIGGDGYWKYGPPTPGAGSAWYRFDPDPGTGTGATLDTVDLGELGFRRAWTLTLTDGGRGDEDGVTDGTIRDPGGPGVGGDASTPPVDPVDPPDVPGPRPGFGVPAVPAPLPGDGATPPPGGSDPDDTQPGGADRPDLPDDQDGSGSDGADETAGPDGPGKAGGPEQSVDTGVPGGQTGERSAEAGRAGALSRTGGDPRPAVGIGLVLLAAGALLLGTGRRGVSGSRSR